MKKLLVPIVVLALVAFAMPVVAQTTASFSGELEFGYITNLSEPTAGAYNNQKTVLKLMPDKINTITMDLRTSLPEGNIVPGGTTDISSLVYANEFSITSDVGMALGIDAMGVDPVLKAGYFNATSLEKNLGGWNFEEMDLELGNASTVQIDTGIMNMVHVKFAYQPASFIANVDGGLLGSIYGTVGPVWGEIVYLTAPATQKNASSSLAALPGDAAKGDFAINLGGAYDVMPTLNLAAQAGFATNLNTNAADGAKSLLDVAVMATYNKMVKVGVDLAGNDKDALNLIGVNIGLIPIPTVGVDLAAAYVATDNLGKYLISDTSGLDSIDASVWTTFGAAKLRLGYLYFDNTKVNVANVKTFGTHATAAAGGVYMDLDLVF